MKHLLVLVIVLSGFTAHSQSIEDVEVLKREVTALREDVSRIQLNLHQGEKRFKKGILVSTIGYSVTIAGGLLLGRKQDDVGKALLIAGGATGITGTVLMVDAFRFFGTAGKK